MKSGIKTLAMWLIIIVVFVVLLNANFNNKDTKMSYSELINSVKAGEVSEITIASDGTTCEVKLKSDNVKKEVTIPSLDSFMDTVTEHMNEDNNQSFQLNQDEPSILSVIFDIFSPFIILIIFLLFWLLLMNPSQNSSKTNTFGKSKARMINMVDDKNKVTFKDVAGVDEEKEELEEIVEFLKSPKKFTDMGARIPKGVLLVGHPRNW